MNDHLRISRLKADALPCFTSARDAVPAWNALLRPCDATPVVLVGKAFRLQTAPTSTIPRAWTLCLDLAGTQIWVDVVPEDLWTLLRHLFPRLEGEVPDPGLSQILVSILAEPGLATLGLQVGPNLSLDLMDERVSAQPDCWTQGFMLSSDAVALSLHVRVAKQPNALGFAQRLKQAIFQPARSKAISRHAMQMNVPICISLGHLNINETELAQIERGGAVVPHGLSLGQHIGVVLVGRRPLAAVSLTGNRATVTEMESEMTEQMMKGVGPDGVLEDLPIKLTFEVGHQTIELGQLCETAPGTVFLMDSAVLDCPVTIKANGLPYAIGHLVTVGASLAVQVDNLIDGDV